MSTVKAANLQNTGSGAPAFKNSSGTEIGQLCKAWVNFNGTGTVAIRDDFNFSSVTDNGTGLYTLNFTTNMANANYAVATSGSRDLPESSRCFPANIDQIATSSFDISTHNDGSTSVDWELVTCVVFGD